MVREEGLESLYQVILNNAFDAIIYYKPVIKDGQITDFTFEYLNDSAFKILTGGRETYIGKRFLELFPYAAEDGMFDLFNNTMVTGKSGEKIFYYEYGEYKGWYRDSVSKYGEGIIVYFRDVTEQKLLEIALEQKSIQLNNTLTDLNRVLESIRDPFIFVDSNFVIRYINDSTKVFLDNVNPEGKSIWELAPRLLNTKIEKILRAALLEQKRRHFRIQGIKTGIRYDVSVYPSPDGLCLLGVNIEELLNIQEKLNQSLHDKELLLKESHHRIKNNLQLVASLLNLGKSNIKDQESLKIFGETSQRITTMATLHKLLYESSNYTSIDICRFSKDILNLIHNLYNSDKAISVNYSCGELYLDTGSAISLGMIVNELLTNSYKYAFRNRPKGEIKLNITGEGNYITLVIEDDGDGLPTELLNKQPETLGLFLVDSLVQQLNGTIDISSPPGTRFHIRFPQSNN